MGSIIKEMFILALGGIALLKMLNPSLGVFEILPDNLPLIGNLDEGGAVILLSNVLAYYGIDLNRFAKH